jgi:hypothetical protein
MKKIKAIVAFAALFSTAAYAMPAAIPDSWYDNQARANLVKSGNPGLCEMSARGLIVPICFDV